MTAPLGSNPGVSLTMIVRNEAAGLADCLASVTGCFAQIVVVDTGSADDTVAIARRCGAEVHAFAWCDDFAAARNAALQQARCPWVFWMDADDRLDAANRDRLQALLRALPDEHLGYVMKCVSQQAHGSATTTEHLRLFRNRPDVRWEYPIHEQIRPAIERTGGRIVASDVRIEHLGYLDPALLRHKAERNLRLLEQQLRSDPENAFALFNLGRTLNILGRKIDAVNAWRSSLANATPASPFLRNLFASLIDVEGELGHLGQGLALCRAGRELFPHDVELLFHEGVLHIEAGDLPAGMERLRQVLETPPRAEALLQEPQLRGKTRYNLAVAHLRRNEIAPAEQQLHAALAEQPPYPEAWYLLGQVWLRAGKHAEVQQAIAALEAASLSNLAAALRGR